MLGIGHDFCCVVVIYHGSGRGFISVTADRNIRTSVFSFLTGRIDFMEVKQSLADLGLDISKEEAEKILNRFL